MIFENFYTGNSYKVEYAAAKAVADSPDESYNPLVLCGPSGIGKTHLISAIVSRANDRKANSKIVHTSADSFIDEMIEYISKGEINQFRKKYCEADILLIDNFELVAAKEHTQEELFRIFDELIQNKKQIVLCVNNNLQDCNFTQRISSRLCSGIILEMKLPDDETKRAIVKGVAKELNLELEENTKNYIVDRTSNAAEIKGLLKSIKMIFDLTKEIPSLDKLKKLLPRFQ